MIANFDYYNRFEQPIISLRSPNDNFIGFVDNIKNLKISPEFNAVSEMTCDIYKYGDDDIELKIYDDIKVKRQLFIEDVGFFIITDISENDSEDGVYKSLTLYSCEHELSYKKLTYFNGTYQFWNSTKPSESLMGMILNSLPRWSIGHVDENIAVLYRTFDEPDTTIFAFLMDDVEDSYGCLFDFDIINRVINVYDKNNYIHKTTILLSKKDVIDSIKVETKSEEIYTAFTLYGDDEITYSGINPLGTSTLYNFNYYKEWMSDGLQLALNTWESNIANAETSISTLRTSLSNKYTELQTIQGEIDSINQQIVLLEKQLGVNTLDTTMVSNLTAQINTKKSELATQQTAYNSKADEISAINQQLDEIYASCSFESNFTEEQIQELDAYIYEGSDVDDTFAFTDDMSYEEQEQILVDLYNKAKSMLSDISVPTEELSLDTNNFVFQKEFLPYTEQLNTGVIVDVEIKDDVIVSYVLLKMEVNYQDKTINLTFGNKYRSSAAENLWSDWESKVSKSSTTLTYERSKYGKAVDSGSLDRMNTFMKSSLDLTLNQIKSSDGQSLDIKDSGLKARRIDPNTGDIDPRQLWLASNGIVFTDDDWQTIKTAIGRLILPDGTEGYGVNAEYLIGKLIMANGMVITNEGGTFLINEDGVMIDSKYFKVGVDGSLIASKGKIGTMELTEDGYLYNIQYSNPPESIDTIDTVPMGIKMEALYHKFSKNMDDMTKWTRQNGGGFYAYQNHQIKTYEDPETGEVILDTDANYWRTDNLVSYNTLGITAKRRFWETSTSTNPTEVETNIIFNNTYDYDGYLEFNSSIRVESDYISLSNHDGSRAITIQNDYGAAMSRYDITMYGNVHFSDAIVLGNINNIIVESGANISSFFAAKSIESTVNTINSNLGNVKHRYFSIGSRTYSKGRTSLTAFPDDLTVGQIVSISAVLIASNGIVYNIPNPPINSSSGDYDSTSSLSIQIYNNNICLLSGGTFTAEINLLIQHT